MEVIWIIPLYFIFPSIGLYLIINATLKFKERRNKFVLGLILISLSFLHSLLVESKEAYIDNNICGNYQLKGENDVLIIKENGTFELKKTIEWSESGNGNWQIFHIDSDKLYLNFENNKSLDFDISKVDDNLELKNTSNAKLIKQ